MLTRLLLFVFLILTLSLSMALALNTPGNFILVNDASGIQRLGAMGPFLTVEDLPPTAPEWFPHPKDLLFENQKFHWITQSPTMDLLGFASGTGNEWIGIMNLKDRWLKFISWGVSTRFLDLTFSNDALHYAYAFHSPDGRIKINIAPVPTRDEEKTDLINTWFVSTDGGERYRPLGWDEQSDTVFSFEITDSLGQVLHHVDLNLHYDESLAPAHMLRSRDKQPSGTADLKKE
jgi:hypothetical protein